MDTSPKITKRSREIQRAAEKFSYKEVVEALKIVTREKSVIQNRAKKRRQRRERLLVPHTDSFSFQEQTYLMNIANCVDAIKKSFREIYKIEAKRHAIYERNHTHTELSGMNTMLK